VLDCQLHTSHPLKQPCTARDLCCFAAEGSQASLSAVWEEWARIEAPDASHLPAISAVWDDWAQIEVGQEAQSVDDVVTLPACAPHEKLSTYAADWSNFPDHTLVDPHQLDDVWDDIILDPDELRAAWGMASPRSDVWDDIMIADPDALRAAWGMHP
jgi:hypothetical protein